MKPKPTMADDRIVIAVVGHFQIGKSSLINCLLGTHRASVGNGWKSETPECTDYEMSGDVVLVDTPGVNDTAERDEEALAAIRRAHCILVVGDNEKAPAELYSAWVRKAQEAGKTCLFVCNCKRGATEPKQHWNPHSVSRPGCSFDNASYCREIEESFVGKDKAVSKSFLPIDGRKVLPVNACWALYGLGCLTDEELSEETEVMLGKLKVPEERYRDEALSRSNIIVLHNFIRNVRLELLAHSLSHGESLLHEIADAFPDRFKKNLEMVK